MLLEYEWSFFLNFDFNPIYVFQIYDYAQYYLDLADANRKVAEASSNDDSGMDSSNRWAKHFLLIDTSWHESSELSKHFGLQNVLSYITYGKKE